MRKEIIHTFSSVEKLAEFFAARLAENVVKTPDDGFYHLALSGGSTPKSIFNFISENYKDVINWSKVLIFWGDERCVDPDNDESNYKMAFENLIKNVNIPLSNIYRIEAERDPFLEADRYAELVDKLVHHQNNIPQFDSLMLGLGDDGHTASIFPDNIHLFNSRKLYEISHHPVSKQKRITATGRLINNARQVCFLVTGAGKAERVAQVVEKKNGWQNLPSSLVHPTDGELIWLLDYQAASMLSGGSGNSRG